MRSIIPLRPITGDRHAAGLPGLRVMQEDIVSQIGIPADQIDGKGMKRHVSPIGRNSRSKGTIIPLRPITGDRDAGGLPGLGVMQENISHPIGIPADQIAGAGVKRHVPPAVRDGGGTRHTIALGPITGDRDADDLPCLCVMHKDILFP